MHSRQDDDFLTSLTFQVKEEVVKRYLRERLILEEEIQEYEELLADYLIICDEARTLRDHLACLLVNPDNFRSYWKLLGFDNPPLTRLGHGPLAEQAPSCPIGLTPKGFTKRGRYVKIVRDTYALFYAKAAIGRDAAENLFNLANEINEDIRKFHLNFDIMSIINFLKNMDVQQRVKKRIMGSNFTAAEIGSIEEKMLFNKLKPRDAGVRSWPELPEPAKAARETASFVADIFIKERERILPALRR